jgi:hypothetical protein
MIFITFRLRMNEVDFVQLLNCQFLSHAFFLFLRIVSSKQRRPATLDLRLSVQGVQAATSRLCVRRRCGRRLAGSTSAWGGCCELQRRRQTPGRATTRNSCDKPFRPARWCRRYAAYWTKVTHIHKRRGIQISSWRAMKYYGIATITNWWRCRSSCG